MLHCYVCDKIQIKSNDMSDHLMNHIVTKAPALSVFSITFKVDNLESI